LEVVAGDGSLVRAVLAWSALTLVCRL